MGKVRRNYLRVPYSNPRFCPEVSGSSFSHPSRPLHPLDIQRCIGSTFHSLDLLPSQKGDITETISRSMFTCKVVIFTFFLNRIVSSFLSQKLNSHKTILLFFVALIRDSYVTSFRLLCTIPMYGSRCYGLACPVIQRYLL